MSWPARLAQRLQRTGLGLRLLLAFFLLNGLAAVFVLRIFTAEIKPSAREVMEDQLVDTAHLLAELAAADFAPDAPWVNAQGQASPGGPAQPFAHARFAQAADAYARSKPQANIWGQLKNSADLRIYVTDAHGIVRYDSAGQALGHDHSQWRDVYLTLRGRYGARSSPAQAGETDNTVMHVAAPIFQQGRLVGVLTVAKANRAVQGFITRAEGKIMRRGLWLLALLAAAGVLITGWLVWHVRRLRQFANSVQTPGLQAPSPPAPQAPGELGELAQAMDAMRARLQGHAYVEHYVRGLTHELKSPVAAIRGAAELLQDDLPAADRQRFARQVDEQAARIQRLIDALLQLHRLENARLPAPRRARLADSVHAACKAQQARASQRGISLHIEASADSQHPIPLHPEQVQLACSNLLANAIDFSPPGSHIQVRVSARRIEVQDQGGGVPEWAMPRLGERFFSTARPDGSRSGSGLGLATVRQVMALHGGTLQLANTANGLCASLVFAA